MSRESPSTEGTVRDGPGDLRAPSTPDPRFSVRHMDAAVSPSSDFYRYATGTWVRSNPVPPDKARWGAFDELLQRNFAVVREILEDAEAHRPPGENTPRSQVGTFFASALATRAREERRFAPISADLARIEGVTTAMGGCFDCARQNCTARSRWRLLGPPPTV